MHAGRITPTISYPICLHAAHAVYVVAVMAMTCVKEVIKMDWKVRNIIKAVTPAGAAAVLFVLATTPWSATLHLCKLIHGTGESVAYLVAECGPDQEAEVVQEAGCYTFRLMPEDQFEMCGDLQNKLDVDATNFTLSSQWSDHNCSDDRFLLAAAFLEDKPFYSEIDKSLVNMMREYDSEVKSRAWSTFDGDHIEASTLVGILTKTLAVITEAGISVNGLGETGVFWIAPALDVSSTAFLSLVGALQFSDGCSRVPGQTLDSVATKAFLFNVLAEMMTVRSQLKNAAYRIRTLHVGWIFWLVICCVVVVCIAHTCGAQVREKLGASEGWSISFAIGFFAFEIVALVLLE